MSIYSWQQPTLDKSNLTEFFRNRGYEVLYKGVHKTVRTYAIAKRDGRRWLPITDEDYIAMEEIMEEAYPGSVVIKMDDFLLPDHKKKQTLKIRVPITRSPALTEEQMESFLRDKGFTDFYIIESGRKGSFIFNADGSRNFNEESVEKLKNAMREIGYKAIRDPYSSFHERMYRTRPSDRYRFKLIRQITG